MTCLRETLTEGFSGTVRCDEEGCQLRCIPSGGRWFPAPAPSETHCLLQLQLRAGAVEEFDLNEVRWLGEVPPGGKIFVKDKDYPFAKHFDKLKEE